MKARSVRYAALAVILPLSLLGLAGCKKAPKTTPEAESVPPPKLDVTLQATVARAPSIASLEHDATSPRKPGDTIEVTARATVPEGNRLGVELKGTGFRIPVSSTSAPDVYKGSATLPAIPPGSYRLAGAISAPGGQTVAQLEAPTLVTIEPKTTPCEDAQARLDDLRVPFDYDKSDLGPQAKQILASVAEVLKELKPAGIDVTVEGHCDERGTVDYNIALGNRRAAAVQDYLVDLGVVDRGRASKASFGKERPRNPGHDEAAWAENRRAEFKLLCSTR
jgi:peptidoglycan-associated lipoprotein